MISVFDQWLVALGLIAIMVLSIRHAQNIYSLYLSLKALIPDIGKEAALYKKMQVNSVNLNLNNIINALGDKSLEQARTIKATPQQNITKQPYKKQDNIKTWDKNKKLDKVLH